MSPFYFSKIKECKHFPPHLETKEYQASEAGCRSKGSRVIYHGSWNSFSSMVMFILEPQTNGSPSGKCPLLKSYRLPREGWAVHQQEPLVLSLITALQPVRISKWEAPLFQVIYPLILASSWVAKVLGHLWRRPQNLVVTAHRYAWKDT